MTPLYSACAREKGDGRSYEEESCVQSEQTMTITRIKLKLDDIM